MGQKVLIAGCGYVGKRAAELLVEDGHEVWGLKRNPDDLPDGVTPVAADVTDPSTLEKLPSDLDAVVYAVSPWGRDASAYRGAYVTGPSNVLDAVGDIWFVLVSTTGVYGMSDGRWVDETSDEEPSHPTSHEVLEGEAVVRERGAPGTVLRLGGIYGPGRTRTVRMVATGEASCMGPELYGNRIHRDDAAAALRHILTLDDPAELYLGVDREPAPLRDVYAWVAEQAGVPDPCEGVDPDDWRTEGRRGSNKRCSSDRLVDSGFSFEYPTYREGYGPMIEELT